MPDWIEPDWPAPSRVRALSTLRSGGLSRGPWASQNLGDRCGDDPATVRDNRQRLREAAGLPAEPAWLAQEHGTTVVKAGQVGARAPAADAAVTDRAATVCVVQTADCAPVLLCDRGTMDVLAYIGKDTFDEVLEDNGWTVPQLRDQRYEAVVHLVTAAIGAEDFYLSLIHI